MLLGRDFSYCAKVVKGSQLGRKIGFATANLNISTEKLIPIGVFAVFIKHSNKKHKGVCNIGNKPTINHNKKQLEVHIFDFDMDIYQQQIEVIFIKKIREEKKFPSLEQLKQQIVKDKLKAIEIFNK